MFTVISHVKRIAFDRAAVSLKSIERIRHFTTYTILWEARFRLLLYLPDPLESVDAFPKDVPGVSVRFTVASNGFPPITAKISANRICILTNSIFEFNLKGL